MKRKVYIVFERSEGTQNRTSILIALIWGINRKYFNGNIYDLDISIMRSVRLYFGNNCGDVDLRVTE